MEHLRPTFENQGLITASQRVVDRTKTILVFLIIAEIFLACIGAVNSFDFPWQFAEGTYLLDHGQPARSVLNAYGEISPNFENEYILYEALVVAVERIFGWTGLCAFFSLLAFLIYVPCLWAFARHRHSYAFIDVFLFSLGSFLINMRLSARPELIADVCYVVLGIMLTRLTQPRWTGRQLMALGLIFFLWANAHGTFLLGLAMLGLWYGQLFLFQWKDLLFTRDFRWVLPGLVAAIGCVANPFGFYRIIQPFALHSLLWGQATSIEMWPVGSGTFLLTFIWTGTAVLVLLLRAHQRQFFWLIAMLLLLQYLTFCSIRYNLFIGLSLLIVCWDGLQHPRERYSPSMFGLSFALFRLTGYFAVALIFFNLIHSLIRDKMEMIRVYTQVIYPKGHLANPSSLNWMIEHPTREYNLLSYLVGGSIAQMPEVHGIHPLIDSGTHRYSDRTNEIYYYAFYSPDIFRRLLSQLDINAIAVNNVNSYWAIPLNEDADWHLVQIDDDSQLYLREKDLDQDACRKIFSEWEMKSSKTKASPADISSETILRGIRLRPDADSLKMLAFSGDVLWTQDPQATYLREWLDHVPDKLVFETLESIRGQATNSQVALQITLLLRLHRFQDAAAIAQNWHPAHLNMNFQNLEMLRAEALLEAGDSKAARSILSSLWPLPRYSLSWARLCQKVYAGDPQAMPKNARLLVDLADQTQWQSAIIETLNQNIRRLSP